MSAAGAAGAFSSIMSRLVSALLSHYPSVVQAGASHIFPSLSPPLQLFAAASPPVKLLPNDGAVTPRTSRALWLRGGSRPGSPAAKRAIVTCCGPLALEISATPRHVTPRSRLWPYALRNPIFYSQGPLVAYLSVRNCSGKPALLGPSIPYLRERCLSERTNK